ncbi:MAG: hypothetical protein V4592_26405 [Bacteroidota bacterium]
MFLFGIKSTKSLVEPVSDQCANCQTSNTTDMHIFQKYAHIFYLPLFPAGKKGFSQCNHCRQVLREKVMSESLKRSFEKVKPLAKTPLWTWAGTALVVVYLVFELYFK